MRLLLIAAIACSAVACGPAERYAVRVSRCLVRELPQLVDEAMADPSTEGVTIEVTADELARLRAASP